MRSGLSHGEYALRPLKTVSGKLFTVQRLPYSESDTRFSCVVSKKVVPKAVDRNRAKRRARAAFKEVWPEAGLYVVHVKKLALSANFKELCSELSMLLEKLK